MRQHYWGNCLSKSLSGNKVASEIDFEQIHPMIKQVLAGSYVRPLDSYEAWDGNREKSIEEKDEMYKKIITSWRDISMYINKIDFMMFTNNIVSINNCFSLLTLFPGNSN